MTWWVVWAAAFWSAGLTVGFGLGMRWTARSFRRGLEALIAAHLSEKAS